MSRGGACTHNNTELCVQGGEGEKWGYGGELASDLQGLASNTIWRETIQFAGTREGKRGQMRNRSRDINRSKVTDKRNRSASGLNREKESRVRTTPKCH